MAHTPQLPHLAGVWPNLHWQPNNDQIALFQRLYEGILQHNQQINLTRITQPDEFWEKHLWDSLYGIEPWLADRVLPPLEALPSVQTLIDIGTGGGFPGLPVAIAQPQWHLTCLDSTRKKVAALAELSVSLGLSHVQPVAERAEVAGQQLSHREAYDLALIRAVGSATLCAEYALPLVKVGGMAVLYRGQWSPEEAATLEKAVTQLGGKPIGVQATTTPLSHSARHCIYISKVAATPSEFPRGPGIASKQPLA